MSAAVEDTPVEGITLGPPDDFGDRELRWPNGEPIRWVTPDELRRVDLDHLAVAP